MPACTGWDHNGLMAAVCLVCPVPDHKSRMEGHSKLKIGRKEAHEYI